VGAICKYCQQDMRQVDGCVKMPADLKDGRTLDPIPYGTESETIRVTGQILRSVTIAQLNLETIIMPVVTGNNVPTVVASY